MLIERQIICPNSVLTYIHSEYKAAICFLSLKVANIFKKFTHNKLNANLDLI